MEKTSPFSLSKSVSEWKKSLNSKQIMTSMEIEELESHLMDAIQELKTKGLNSEEALIIASRRLGPACKLEEEFLKVNPSRHCHQPLVWLLTGWISLLLVEQVGRATVGIGFTGMFFGLNATVSGWIATIACMLVWTLGLGGLSWIALNQNSPNKVKMRFRSIYTRKSAWFLTGLTYIVVAVSHTLIMSVGSKFFAMDRVASVYYYTQVSSHYVFPLLFMLVSLISLRAAYIGKVGHQH